MGAYAPPHSQGDGTPPAAPTPPKRVGIFRWRAIFALLAVGVIVTLVLVLFGERMLRSAIEEAGSKALGAEVDIADLDLHPIDATVELRGFAIADPFDPNRNLIQIARTFVSIDPVPLAEKKLGIRDLRVDSVQLGTRRARPARRIAGGGFAPRAMAELQAFRRQFQVPPLSLVPFDTVKSLVLDPKQLQTVQQATALVGRADSLRTDLTERVERLPVGAAVDSAQALAARLRGKTPLTLGITGTRQAIADARRLKATVDSLHRAIDAIPELARADAESLSAGVRSLDAARRADYAFARGLLKLPTFEAPQIGPALFGNVTLDVFAKAMYWMALAERHAPPGLLPREDPGPKRLRRAGTTVRFVEPAAMPAMLLQHAEMTAQIANVTGAVNGNYTIRLEDVTSDPAVLGRPTHFSVSRSGPGDVLLLVAGSLDHTKPTSNDWVSILATEMRLPAFAVPSLPLRADLGRGRGSVRLAMAGESIRGEITLNAGHVAWVRDSSRALNTVESYVVRVLEKVPTLDMRAQVGGTRERPTFNVRSNLDVSVANAVQATIGEEVARAEARVRAQVDAEAERAVAPVRARAAALRTDAEARARDARARLDAAYEDALSRLRELRIPLPT